MRGEILKNWRIVAATLFSTLLIAGAYVFAHGFDSPQVAQASTETELLKAIATKDSDSDGLPDWEEALYGTDPHVADSSHLGMTDGEAVARGLIVPKAIADIKAASPSAANGLSASTEGTLTDAFAKNFFTYYAAAKQKNGGVELTSAEIQSLETQTINSLTSSVMAAPDFKSEKDLEISGTGPDALRAFAVAAEAVLKKNASDATKSDLQYLQDAIENSDTSALTRLASMAKSYRNTAIGLAALSVPKELATVDLAIVNALMRLSEIYSDFARVNTDPLAAMLALEQYKQTELGAEHAFMTLFNMYVAAGVSLPNGTPGAAFVNIAPNMSARQAATRTP